MRSCIGKREKNQPLKTEMTRTDVPIWLDSNLSHPLLLSELRKIDAASRGRKLGRLRCSPFRSQLHRLTRTFDHYKLVVQKTSLYYKFCDLRRGLPGLCPAEGQVLISTFSGVNLNLSGVDEF